MIEVIIAVLLLSAVIAAVALATTGGARLRGAARLQLAMTHTGQQLQEKLIGHRDWMQSCASKCTLTSQFTPDDLKLDDIDEGTVVLTDAFAEPIDSDIDGKGKNDRDGVIPDYYRISITIEPAPDLRVRYGLRPGEGRRTFTTSIDSRGTRLVGSVAVQACQVVNQMDARMTIQGCNTSGISNISMMGCPPLNTADYRAYGCKPAWNWVDAQLNSPPRSTSDARQTPNPFVTMQQVTSLSFTLVGNGVSISSGRATRQNGLWVFENIPAGLYKLKGLPANYNTNYQRWPEKEIPSYLGARGNELTQENITVEPGVRSRVLVMFRPKPTKGIRLHFRRYTESYTVKSDTEREDILKNHPTKTYQGNNAQFCIFWEPIGRKVLGPDGIGYNCSDTDNTQNNCHSVYEDYSYPETLAADNDGDGINDIVPARTERSQTVFCTYYDEWQINKYYTVKNTKGKTRDGAAVSASYTINPEPDFRGSRLGPDGKTYIPGEATCITRGHQKGYADQEWCVNGSGLDPLEPGLNSSILNGSCASNATNCTSAAQNYNYSGNGLTSRNYRGIPSWTKSGALWVRPNGAILARDGATIQPDTQLNLIGQGECYWKGVRPSEKSTYEAECGKCNMFYDGRTYPGGCNLVTESCVRRNVWEVITTYKQDGSIIERGRDLMSPVKKKKPCLDFDPPFYCSGAPHLAINSTCRRATKPASFEGEPYSGNAGTAEVADRNPTSSRPLG